MSTALRVMIAVAMVLSVVGVGLASEPDVGSAATTPTAVDATPQATSSADLAVFTTGEREFTLHTPMTYAFMVVNDGPSAASGVKLRVLFEGAATLISATPSQGTCSLDRDVVTCDLDSLPNDGRASIAIQLISNYANWITRTANVVGDQDDPNTVNNRVAATSLNGGPRIIIDPPGTPV